VSGPGYSMLSRNATGLRPTAGWVEGLQAVTQLQHTLIASHFGCRKSHCPTCRSGGPADQSRRPPGKHNDWSYRSMPG